MRILDWERTLLAQCPTLISLKKEPWRLDVLHQEKAGLLARELSLTAGRFIRLLSYASYDSSLLKDIPAAIVAVSDRDKGSLSIKRLSENFLEMEAFDGFSIPVFLATECFENGGFDTKKLTQKLQLYQEKYPMLDLSLGSVYAPRICEGWRQLSLSKVRDFRAPVSVYLEYPNTAHGVLHSSLCANDEVQRFLNPGQQVTAFCDAKERRAEREGSSLSWAD